MIKNFKNLNSSSSNALTKIPPNSFWKKKYTAKLLELSDRYNQNWSKISKSLTLFCEDECKSKFFEIKSQEKLSSWTYEEDLLLKKLTTNFNKVNWYECSIMIPGRNSLECMKRSAILILNKNIIGKWSHGEQILIFRFTKMFEFSWKIFIKFLPGRSQNSVKSFFHSTIRRIKKSDLFKFLKVMVTWPTYTLSLIHI